MNEDEKKAFFRAAYRIGFTTGVIKLTQSLDALQRSPLPLGDAENVIDGHYEIFTQKQEKLK